MDEEGSHGRRESRTFAKAESGTGRIDIVKNLTRSFLHFYVARLRVHRVLEFQFVYRPPSRKEKYHKIMARITIFYRTFLSHSVLSLSPLSLSRQLCYLLPFITKVTKSVDLIFIRPPKVKTKGKQSILREKRIPKLPAFQLTNIVVRRLHSRITKKRKKERKMQLRTRMPLRCMHIHIMKNSLFALL